MARDWSTTYHYPHRPAITLTALITAMLVPAFTGMLLSRPYWQQNRYWAAGGIMMAGMFGGILLSGFVEDSFTLTRRRRLARVWQEFGMQTSDHVEESFLSRNVRPVGVDLEMVWAAAASVDKSIVIQLRFMESHADQLAMISCRVEAPLPRCAIMNAGEKDWLYKPLAGVRAAREVVETIGSVELRSTSALAVSPCLRALVEEMRPDEAVIVDGKWLHVLWIGPLSEEGMRQLIARPEEWTGVLEGGDENW